MTESEAKGFIQGKLDCMKKCGIFNKEDNVSDKDCDNCDYCYSQGNFGEQKNAFEMAIKVLEDVQQYRAIGTLEECREAVEKQIPKKPVEIKPTDKLLNGYFSCPMCGGWVGMDEYSNEYCGCCGQKINWSDEE